MFRVLIALMITVSSQHVQNKMITVNTNEGSESTECCVQGECPCSSLSIALQNMSNDTIINITSEAITLKNNIEIGSGNLNNIAITSYVATITCSNTTIYCASCDDVTVSGITWVDCNFALSNSTTVNCTLMHSNFVVSGSISIERSVSLSTSSLWINNTNYTGYVNFTISGSTFYWLSVSDSSCLAQWNITIINTTLTSGPNYTNTCTFSICADVLYGVHIANSTVSRTISGIYLELNTIKGNISVSVLSSVFVDNDNALQCIITTHSEDSSISVLINDTEFINNGDSFPSTIGEIESLVDLSINFNATSSIILNHVNFTNNHLFMFSTRILSLLPMFHTEVSMTNVNFIRNDFFISDDFSAAVYIEISGPNY